MSIVDNPRKSPFRPQSPGVNAALPVPIGLDLDGQGPGRTRADLASASGRSQPLLSSIEKLRRDAAEDSLRAICEATRTPLSFTGSGDRDRFTIGHERGHVVLHSYRAPGHDAQTEAHRSFGLGHAAWRA
ncbi:MAG TPA: XRE family transcriptional regulator [Cellulomonas sp.]